MIVGYARTSTTDQAAGLAAQERDLTAAGAERIFGEQFQHRQAAYPQPRLPTTHSGIRPAGSTRSSCSSISACGTSGWPTGGPACRWARTPRGPPIAVSSGLGRDRR